MDSDFIVSLFDGQGNAPTQLEGNCVPLENSPTDERVMENGPKETMRLQTQFRVRVAILEEEPK
jgi:hypothetical protein